MKTISLLEYFEETKYNWEKDLESLSHILELTKTRVKENAPEDYYPSAGAEQTFFMKSVAEHISAEMFFEIGTGRGTSCYALSLLDSVEEIITVDIVSHYQKKNEAINHKPVIVSNADLYNKIKFDEKEKIKFKHVSEMPYIKNEYGGEIDLAFIDGNHSDYNIVMQDYLNCKELVKPGGLIVFDDYHEEKFVVKKVVDDIVSEDSNIDPILVNVFGQLFDTEKKQLNQGMVIVKV